MANPERELVVVSDGMWLNQQGTIPYRTVLYHTVRGWTAVREKTCYTVPYCTRVPVTIADMQGNNRKYLCISAMGSSIPVREI